MKHPYKPAVVKPVVNYAQCLAAVTRPGKPHVIHHKLRVIHHKVRMARLSWRLGSLFARKNRLTQNW